MVRKKEPFFSIITVVYNAEDFIEETIKSIIGQTYNREMELIIIDGESKDKTIDILDKYKNKIDIFISEKDKGIYDAMNKGIELANGKWICFMNAGDYFYNEKTLEDIHKYLLKKPDFQGILYGDSVVVYNDGYNWIRKAGEIKDLWKGMVFSHQSMYIEKEVVKKLKYDINYKICSDYNQCLQAVNRGYDFEQIDVPLSKISLGGVSDIDRIFTLKEFWKISKKFNNSKKIDLYFVSLIFRTYLIETLKKLLGEKNRNFVISILRKNQNKR